MGIQKMRLIKKRKMPFGKKVNGNGGIKMEYDSSYANKIIFRSWTELLMEKGKRKYHWMNQNHEENPAFSTLTYPGR